jgi:hypothetical protein
VRRRATDVLRLPLAPRSDGSGTFNSDSACYNRGIIGVKSFSPQGLGFFIVHAVLDVRFLPCGSIGQVDVYSSFMTENQQELSTIVDGA